MMNNEELMVPHKIYCFRRSYAQTDVVITGLVSIILLHQSGNFIAPRNIQLEKLDDSRYELCNFDSNAVYEETDVSFVLFVRFVYPLHTNIKKKESPSYMYYQTHFQ
jgi:hypothetical protein